METYFTLSNAAGLIRSNKFIDKADAICVASYRAETLGLPVKLFEHKEPGDGVCILICMPDGSVKAPQGAGMKTADLGNASSGAKNASEAYMLLSSYEEMPITTFYLKGELSETLAQQLEKDLGIELGLYDANTLHAYTEDSSKLKSIESKLAEASVEIERVKDSKVKRERLQAAAELVEAAKKARHIKASSLPSMTVKASSQLGKDLKLNCHCETVTGSNGSSPKIIVYGDGVALATVKNDREAARVMADYAEKCFAKFLKKELA